MQLEQAAFLSDLGRLEPGGGRIARRHDRRCLRAALILYGGPDVGVAWAAWGADTNRAMTGEFVAAIREGREPAVTRLDGLRALEIVDAAYRSIRAGKSVRLEHGRPTRRADR